MFKTIKPYASGGHGLGSNRRFEAAFEGGWDGYPADADRVVEHLRELVRTDRALAECVVAHDVLDGSGIVGLADLAREVLAAPEPYPLAEGERFLAPFGGAPAPGATAKT